MSKLQCMNRMFEVTQYDPSPAWVAFIVDDIRYTFYADEFLVFVAWINAEAKKIRTDREIDQERNLKR